MNFDYCLVFVSCNLYLMKINSIKLINLRSWQDYNLEFSDVTILIGPNGIGKTNVVEAVYLAATGRSWRTTHDEEMIYWGQDFSRITLDLVKTDKAEKLELFWQKGEKPVKQLKLNGVKHRLLDLLGQIPTVLFSPESLELLSGAPTIRRRFLDILLSQTDRYYALNLLEYGKVLRERNKLLGLIKAHRGKPDELDFWDGKLVELGVYIVSKRKDAIKFFNKSLNTDYEKISGKAQKLNLHYKASIETERFADALSAGRERDIEQVSTSHGPHRDDFTINLDSREVASFGSRGEFRSVILALKMAELEYLADVTQEKPILLLDDIFSELDAARRKHLSRIVSGQQTIITTTDLDHIEKKLREKAKIVELK